MNILKFKDGSELQLLQVNGQKTFYQNANRDSLEFVFSENESMDELTSIFSDENKTSVIKLVNDDSEFLYNDYVIQISIKKEKFIIDPESSDTPEISESRISITMGQLTYTEKLLKQLLNN